MTLPTETSLRDFHDLDTWPLVQTLTVLVDSNAATVEAVIRALPDLERAAAGVERALAAGAASSTWGPEHRGAWRCKMPLNCRRPLGLGGRTRFWPG